MSKKTKPSLTRATPHILSLDIETFSSENLSKSGVYRYAEAEDFRILLIGYSLDKGPVKVADLASGEPIPKELLNALFNPAVEKWAFNASFERVCLSRLLRDLGYLKQGAFLPPQGWRCSMIWSAYLGLPMSLAGAGAVLGLDKQKLESGKALIRFFCQPSPPSLLNAQGNRNLPSTDPERWKEFVSYNIRDVETEMGIQQRLASYPVPEEVWKEYELDQVINDRGIRVDTMFVKRALAIDALSREELTAELSRLTEIQNPNSAAQIRDWLKAHGQETEGLTRKEVKKLLERQVPVESKAAQGQGTGNRPKMDGNKVQEHRNPAESGTASTRTCLSEEVREVLLLRQQLAKTSVKKYQAMENSVCADGRVRGMFQFYGAARSGRWAGRLVQLQNLPQNHLDSLDDVRTIVSGPNGPIGAKAPVEPSLDPVLLGPLSAPNGAKAPSTPLSSYETLKLLYDSVPDVLSELLRTAFIPAEGKQFIVCDFSAIEARVIAWLAGESWRQEAFAAGSDIYCASASKMFHVPVEKHGVNAHLRQKGKIAELALGYGGGVGALISMGALEMGVAEAELQPLVDAWRAANPNIVRLWWNVDRAVITAIRQKTTVKLFNLKFSYRSGMLFIELPSGRSLSYPKPKLSENRFGKESVTYMGPGPTRRWEEIESYGPKFVENIVQGISRDLLVNAMFNVTAVPGTTVTPAQSGPAHRDPVLLKPSCEIVAHVHDELILEADPAVTVEEVSERMSQTPPWAKGLILRGDGYTCTSYRKC